CKIRRKIMETTSLDLAGIAMKLLLSLAVVVVTLIVYRTIRDAIKRRIKDATRLQSMRVAVRNVLAVASFLIITLIWLPTGNNLAIALGIVGAGLAIASQELIGSLAAGVNIWVGNIYRVGDRVRIGDVVGDVMDISLARTTVMEVGEWVKADQYTGRVVNVANRMVWTNPVYNFTQHWGYLWDEITLPFTYESDWQRAAELMLEHGQTYTAELQADAEAKLSRLIDRYPLKDTKVEPTLYLAMTDNWIEMTLRFVVDAQERRRVKDQLHRNLLQHIQKEENITVASTTIEIVGFPPLQVDQRNK
ncbi:MAG: mechanosensitive ion channel domain-containing protein, partial [Anaerolineales bacterium]